MAVTIRDDSIPRSIMFLCLGAALVLLGIQWHSRAATQASPQTPPEPGSNRPREMLQTLTSATVATAIKPAVALSSPSLTVDLSQRQVYIFQQDKVLASYPVAIGQAGWETPTGVFHVTNRRRNPTWAHPITGEVVKAGANNPLGSRWIGFWTDGQTELGFHGTPQEELVGQAVSHGCLRMRNRDVEALYELVTEGTQVTVKP